MPSGGGGRKRRKAVRSASAGAAKGKLSLAAVGSLVLAKEESEPRIKFLTAIEQGHSQPPPANAAMGKNGPLVQEALEYAERPGNASTSLAACASPGKKGKDQAGQDRGRCHGDGRAGPAPKKPSCDRWSSELPAKAAAPSNTASSGSRPSGIAG